jgi:hypothetical protein
MAAEINALKGQLKLDPKRSAIAKDNKKKDDKGDNKRDKKTKNKKDTSNKKFQKKDEEWKKVPPKAGGPKEKQVGRFNFQWCEHHMAWMAHKPQDCRLNLKHMDYQGGKKGDYKAHSAVVASSATAPLATTTLDNHYAAFLATITTMQNEE